MGGSGMGGYGRDGMGMYSFVFVTGSISSVTQAGPKLTILLPWCFSISFQNLGL